MKEREKKLDHLFDTYLDNGMSQAEQDAFLDLLQDTALQETFEKRLAQEMTPSLDEPSYTLSAHQIADRVHKRLFPTPHAALSWARQFWKYAAVLFLFLSIALVTYFTVQKPNDRTTLTSRFGDDYVPSAQQPVLRFDDGRSVSLLADKDGIQVTQGMLQYTDGSPIVSGSKNRSVILEVPKGSGYQITLPDGTQVQLNAASRLHYPTQFQGNQRIVELEGEAYFKVIKNTQQPFIVKSRGQAIQVLGTIFNVKAYADDPVVQTTLVEGSVAITANDQHTQLQPGQQAVWDQSTLQTKEADIASALGWKNNQFVFRNTALVDILSQLERWYDIQVVDKDHLPHRTFYGRIDRSVPLSEVLDMLASTSHLNFTVKERRLTVQ